MRTSCLLAHRATVLLPDTDKTIDVSSRIVNLQPSTHYDA